MGLSHTDSTGKARMVDVSGKGVTERLARAEGVVRLGGAVGKQLGDTAITAKGSVLEVARLAGIGAAKRTAELIPLCHPIALSKIGVDITLDEKSNTAHIIATARTIGKTGVEMEALTAVSVALLTVYDMCKAVDKHMAIADITLIEKVKDDGD